jgi:2,3-bisphosphoglycerate-independent phosphoglycerate mutase
LRQYHTAETEKYAHITYFINGGVEKSFPLEDRLMIPSRKDVKTYDQAPEMSAGLVTESLLQAIKKNIYDGIIVNFANTDMVGHTGNLKATIKAVEYVDKCLALIVDAVLKQNGVLFVFADHGNAEQMVNPKSGDPDTEHTTNPVPFIIISNDEKLKDLKLRSDGNLASIVPTVLDIMGIEHDHQSKEKSLIINNENE